MKILSTLRARQIALAWSLLLLPGASRASEHLQLAGVWGRYDFRASSTVLAACESPSGGTITAVSTDGAVRIWALDGVELHAWPGARQLAAAAFGRDCTRILSASPDGELQLADVQTRRVLRSFEQAARSVRCLASSPDGFIAVSGGSNGRVRLWNPESGKQIAALPAEAVLCAGVSRDGRRMATASSEGVTVWDAQNGRQVFRLPVHHRDVRAVAFSPDGASMVTGMPDGTVQVWDLQSRREVQTLTGHRMPVTFVAVSSDGSTALSAAGVEVRRWDLAAGREVRTTAGHTAAVDAIAVSPDGALAASASDDRTVRIWDVPTGTLKQTLRGHLGALTSVAFSPDGRLLLSGGRDDAVRLWDPGRGQAEQVFSGHSDVVSAVAFGPDGRMLSASWDRSVRAWESPRGRVLLTESAPILAMAAARGLILTGDAEGELTLWNGDGTKVRAWRGHRGEVYALGISPDGKLGASGGRDAALKVWELTTGNELQSLRGHRSYVASAAFSADGKQIASAGGDQTVRVWDAATGIELASANLPPTMEFAQVVAFLPDGSVLAGTNRGVILRFTPAKSLRGRRPQ